MVVAAGGGRRCGPGLERPGAGGGCRLAALEDEVKVVVVPTRLYQSWESWGGGLGVDCLAPRCRRSSCHVGRDRRKEQYGKCGFGFGDIVGWAGYDER